MENNSGESREQMDLVAMGTQLEKKQQHSDSLIYIQHIFFYIMICHKMLNIVPCAIQ